MNSNLARRQHSDLVARRVFVPKHIAGTENIADLCTKAVSRATFVHLMTRLMPA